MPITVVNKGTKMSFEEVIRAQSMNKRGKELSRKVRLMLKDGRNETEIARELKISVLAAKRYAQNAEAEERRRTITREELIELGKTMTITQAAAHMRCERSLISKLLKRLDVPRDAFRRG